MVEATATSVVATEGLRNKESTKTKGYPRRKSVSAIISIFLFSLTIPAIFYVGPIRLSAYRVILLVFFIPCCLTWLSGRLGKSRAPDVLILLSVLWSIVALIVSNELDVVVEPAGILLVETLGSYLLARCFIRDQRSFLAMGRTLFFLVAGLMPFAAYEALTGYPIILETLRRVVQVFPNVQMEPRFGVQRAQVVFEHPILYGTFCASTLGLVFYVINYKRSMLVRLTNVGLVILASMFSVSTGALAALVVQMGFILWDYSTRWIKNRWRVLGFLFASAYLAIDFLSNRTPFHVFVTYLTFSVSSSYGRILIWNYGTAEVARRPFFGIGLGDWERPTWMSASMDNFWLVIAVTYGLPAFVLFAGGVLLIIKRLSQLKLEDHKMRGCRAGLLVTLGGLIVAGCTVDYWNATYCLFLFLLGSGSWMLEEYGQQNTGRRRLAIPAEIAAASFTTQRMKV